MPPVLFVNHVPHLGGNYLLGAADLEVWVYMKMRERRERERDRERRWEQGVGWMSQKEGEGIE